MKGRLVPQNLLKGRIPSRPSSWFTRPWEKIYRVGWDVNAMRGSKWNVNTYNSEDVAQRRERDEDIKGAFCRRAVDVAE